MTLFVLQFQASFEPFFKYQRDSEKTLEKYVLNLSTLASLSLPPSPLRSREELLMISGSGTSEFSDQERYLLTTEQQRGSQPVWHQ